MAGTKAGGQKAAAKNLAKDPSFYAKIGAKGGRNGNTGGFAADNVRARTAGSMGGTYSRKGHKLLERTETSGTYRRLSDGAIVEIKY